MFYSVTLVAQQDRHLRQISDTEKTVECTVEDDAFLVRSKAMRDAVEKEILGYNKGSNRYLSISLLARYCRNSSITGYIINNPQSVSVYQYHLVA